MANLQIQYNRTTLPNGYILKDMGQARPNWARAGEGTIIGDAGQGINNLGAWWSQGGTHVTDVFSSVTSDGHSYVQYGQNVSIYATAKFFHFKYSIINEVLHDDGSVDADVVITVDNAVPARKTQYSTTGYNITNTLKISSNLIASYTGKSSDEYTLYPATKSWTQHVMIPPRSYANALSIIFSTHYTNGEFPDLSIGAGANIFNPNYGLYTPMKLKVNGQWITLNNTAKKNKRKKNGSWVDIAQENLSSQNAVNTGHNRRKKGGQYQQMPLPK
ncbi:TPA: hypothetical protein SLS48_005528 [Klebsiella pneumoniae]|nr:hypothetical protein [Klebsiella pneumoniae]